MWDYVDRSHIMFLKIYGDVVEDNECYQKATSIMDSLASDINKMKKEYDLVTLGKPNLPRSSNSIGLDKIIIH